MEEDVYNGLRMQLSDKKTFSCNLGVSLSWVGWKKKDLHYYPAKCFISQNIVETRTNLLIFIEFVCVVGDLV